VILFLAITALVIVGSDRIVEAGRTLAEALPGLLDKLKTGQLAFQIGSRRGWSYNTQIRLQEELAAHSGAILQWVSSTGASLAVFAQNIIWIVLIPILAVFFLKDGRAFTDEILEMTERRQQKQFLSGIIGDLNEMLARYIR